MIALWVVLGLLGYGAIGRFVAMPLAAWVSGRFDWEYDDIGGMFAGVFWPFTFPVVTALLVVEAGKRIAARLPHGWDYDMWYRRGQARRLKQ